MDASVDVDWLTEVLRHAGFLATGSVASIDVSGTGAFNSRTVRRRLEYAGADHGAPTRLVLKRPATSSWSLEAAKVEGGFYRLVGELTEHPPVLAPCYAVGPDDDPYLLFEDLADTHRSPITRDQIVGTSGVLPSAADRARVVETMARLHAYWWEHPSQGVGDIPFGYWSGDGEGFEHYAARRERAWWQLIDQHGSWLPDDIRTLYEQVFAGLVRHWDTILRPRVEEHRRLTLCHGDAYFSNFLCPNEGPGPAILLDWQCPGFDIGALDLVNLVATFWTSTQRSEQQRELRLLRKYHAQLQRYGVSNYAFDDLCIDYRIGLIYWLLVPVQDAYGGARTDYWWPKMQCLAAAFRDWKCAELLT